MERCKRDIGPRDKLSADGLFTWQEVECLGACADAPVMLVNDRQMLSFMEPARLEELLEMLKAQPAEKV